MVCRLRPRLLDRHRLVKALAVVLILALLLGHKHRSARSSHAHEISSSASITTARELVAAISFSNRFSAADASQPQYAQALCRDHGLDIFHKAPVPRPGGGSAKRKVFDLVDVGTELDWLEIRLNSTYDFVDYFVIVEGRKTAAGADKPLAIKDNWGRFAAYHDKIIYHELAEPAAADDSSRRQQRPQHRPADLTRDKRRRRNAPFAQVFPRLAGAQAPTQGDVLLVANVDELVRPEALLVLRACELPRRLTLHSRLYYYSFQLLRRGMDWPHPQATTYQGMRDTLMPDDLRGRGGAGGWGGYFRDVAQWPDRGDLWNAGWYCSSCRPAVDEVVQTVEGSQVLWTASKDQERDGIVALVRRGVGLRDRDGEMFYRIQHNKDVPAALLAETERWRCLLDRYGMWAGIVD